MDKIVPNTDCTLGSRADRCLIDPADVVSIRDCVGCMKQKLNDCDLCFLFVRVIRGAEIDSP